MSTDLFNGLMKGRLESVQWPEDSARIQGLRTTFSGLTHHFFLRF